MRFSAFFKPLGVLCDKIRQRFAKVIAVQAHPAALFL